MVYLWNDLLRKYYLPVGFGKYLQYGFQYAL